LTTLNAPGGGSALIVIARSTSLQRAIGSAPGARATARRRFRLLQRAGQS